MMHNFIRKNLIFIILSLYFVIAVIMLYYITGTGERGSGDSVLHYLYAKHAINDVSLFFNHWAKPIYVLLAFPFAQFGIKGLMFFNVVLALLTAYFTYKTSTTLQLKNAVLTAVVLICTPLYFTLIFSGLTEPLFALVLILSTYLFAKERWLFGSILLSFLPFVRSEGLIFLGVFAFFLLVRKKSIIIPFLGIGHLFYAITGYFIHHDFLWIFNRIPYAKLSSTYGSGRLFHFVDQFFYVVGLPIYVLFIIGIISIVYFCFRKKSNLMNETTIIILGGFFAYFVAHSLFWYLGIFNSMGLKRVLIAVAPFISIVSIVGFNSITENVWINNKKNKTIASWIIIITIILFPISGNKAGVNWKEDFSLTNHQIIANDVVNYLSDEVKDEPVNFIFSNPYLSEVLNINHFNSTFRKELNFSTIDSASMKDIIIWDSWYCVVENGITKEMIVSETSLKSVKTFLKNDNGKEIGFIVFKKK